MTITTRSPAATAASRVGRAIATNNNAKSRSCSHRSRLLRIRWNGVLTCKSCTDFCQSSVVGTANGLRRSFKKYSATSSGTVMPAAINAVNGERKDIAAVTADYADFADESTAEISANTHRQDAKARRRQEKILGMSHFLFLPWWRLRVLALFHTF